MQELYMLKGFNEVSGLFHLVSFRVDTVNHL